MKHIILRAVAFPPTLFWVPYKIAALNVSLTSVGAMIGILVFNLNPIWLVIILLASHGFLVSVAAREPHLDTLIDAWTVKSKRSKNLIKTNGNKFIP